MDSSRNCKKANVAFSLKNREKVEATEVGQSQTMLSWWRFSAPTAEVQHETSETFSWEPHTAPGHEGSSLCSELQLKNTCISLKALAHSTRVYGCLSYWEPAQVLPRTAQWKLPSALAEVAQWIESWPMNRKVASSVPSQGTCLGCGPGPQLEACERQPIDISVPLFLLPFPSL